MDFGVKPCVPKRHFVREVAVEHWRFDEWSFDGMAIENTQLTIFSPDFAIVRTIRTAPGLICAASGLFEAARSLCIRYPYLAHERQAWPSLFLWTGARAACLP